MPEITTLTTIDVSLADPAQELVFLAWWDEADSFLTRKLPGAQLELTVVERGRYRALLRSPFPSWDKVVADPGWQMLDRRRPPGRLEATTSRLWRRTGTRDVTTSELDLLLAERDAGRRDLVLAEALGREAFDRWHIPGAVSLPAAEIDGDRAAAAIGPKDRQVILYCGGYG